MKTKFILFSCFCLLPLLSVLAAQQRARPPLLQEPKAAEAKPPQRPFVSKSLNSVLRIEEKLELGELVIHYKQQKLLVYAFATNQFKPYVRELYALNGVNLLRDAPADHLHHHGLMYAIRVNDLNFWEEPPTAGVEKPMAFLDQKVGKNAAGLPQVSFTQLIHWIAPKDKALADTSSAALLVERRMITLTVDEANQEVALQWRPEFEVGPGAQKVILSGASYHGLGLRLPKGFDRVARHENSANLPYATGGKGDVTPAQWSAVSGLEEGKEMMTALFGHPSNPGGTAKFFTMLEPFAYLAVTQGLDKAPLAYAPGEKFSLNYLLTVYNSRQSPEFLRKRGQAWEQTDERKTP
ncbi:MAG: PmoA family protein [Chloroflexi bacterium]|nr:PmoA family protein [Chloroflexota bacterium]